LLFTAMLWNDYHDYAKRRNRTPGSEL